MIKKHGLWYAIKYYCILQLTALAVVLLIVRNCLIQTIPLILSRSRLSRLNGLVSFTVNVGFVVLWTAITFILIRNKSYKYKTGRNFGYDHSHYKRTYSELVDYFKDAEPHKLDTSLFPVQSWRDAKGIVFGSDEGRLITIPSDAEGNIAVFGPPGSGKTSSIGIISALKFKGSVLAVDVKGDIYNFVRKHSKRKILRFCPDNPAALHDSIRFNPFAGLNIMDSTEKKLYLESMATILISDEGGNDSNYFSSRARKMFQGITHLILSEKPNASFPDVVHAILQGNIFDFVTQAINSDCEPAKELLSSFYGNNEKNITSAYDALTTALVQFSNPILDELLSNKGKCVSVKALEKGYDIYLQISQEHLDAYAPLFTLFIQSFSTAFTKRPDKSTGHKNRPILMLLDEFPQLTFSYKIINSNLSTLRSKSIICMIIQQNMSQLEYRYQPTGARSIIGNCNYQLILGSNDINSSKAYSEMFGTKKVLKISTSENSSDKGSGSRSIQEATERVFQPEHFGDLPNNSKAIVYYKGKYCECDKLNCYKKE